MFKYLLVFLFISIASTAFAAQRVELFDAKVQVDSQGAEERALAFGKALSKVLSRIAGITAEDTELKMGGLVSNASAYVLGFRYQENPRYDAQSGNGSFSSKELARRASAQALGIEVSAPEKPFTLSVQFSESALLGGVRSANLPVWGALRPSILSWVVVQRDSRRTLLSSDFPKLEQQFLSAAEDSGLVVFLPVADLEDLSLINTNQLWGLFPESIHAASKRYPHDVRLMVRVFEADESLEAKWKLVQGNLDVGGRVQAADYKALWRLLNQGVSLELAKRYAILSSGQSDASVRAVVSGIDGFASYVHLTDHLQSLSSVVSAQLLQVAGDEMTLDIVLQGGLSSFQQQVGLAGMLSPTLAPAEALPQIVNDDEQSTSAVVGAQQLYYTWQSSKELYR